VARASDSTRALLDAVRDAPWATGLVLGAILVVAAAPAVSMAMHRPARGVAIAAVAMAVAVATGVSTYMSGFASSDSLKQFTADTLRIAGPDAQISSYEMFEEQILFYVNRRVPPIGRPLPPGDDEESQRKRRELERGNRVALDEFLGGPGARYVLMRREDYDALDAPRRAGIEIVLESHRPDRKPEEQTLLLRRAGTR
jgi:hypothetical protein